MLAILDDLHEDLNSAPTQASTCVKVPQLAPLDDEVSSVLSCPAFELEVQVLAQQQWNAFTERNQSAVVDSFYGLLRSKVTCGSCGVVSTTFEPFPALSVPIPLPNMVVVECTMVPCSPDRILQRVSACKGSYHQVMSGVLRRFSAESSASVAAPPLKLLSFSLPN